jgi:sugar phosphate isomerase/epimerase
MQVMKKAVCHYSYHRTLKDQDWSLKDFVSQCEKLDVDGVDFHARFLPEPAEAPAAIKEVLSGSALELSGLSLSTNFNKEARDFEDEVASAIKWIQSAGEAGASVSRVFGGHTKDRSDSAGLETALARVMQAMERLVPEAEKAGVILAVENHGGVPGTGEEQVELIQKINSPYLRATVDVGNYMGCGQEGVDGTALAAPLCAYVHFKDFKKLEDGSLGACVVGKGDVDHAECLRLLKEAGYDGYVALEYEGVSEEMFGVQASIEFMHQVMKEYS